MFPSLTCGSDRSSGNTLTYQSNTSYVIPPYCFWIMLYFVLLTNGRCLRFPQSSQWRAAGQACRWCWPCSYFPPAWGALANVRFLQYLQDRSSLESMYIYIYAICILTLTCMCIECRAPWRCRLPSLRGQPVHNLAKSNYARDEAYARPLSQTT